LKEVKMVDDMPETTNAILSANEKKDILDGYGKHYSNTVVQYLKAGNLDLIEVQRSGVKFVDACSGKDYFDAFGSAGCFNVGRSNQDIVDALQEVSSTGDMGSSQLLSRHKIEFARKLVTHCPGDLNRVLLSAGGGEAVDSALKLAKAATGRDEVVIMKLAYHGHSGFSVSASGKEHYKDPFEPLLPGFNMANFNDLSSVQALASHKTAAIILEPLMGEGGIHAATDEFLKGVRKLCDELGIVLIFDEIQSGFARTGKLWFCQHSGVVPDIMVLAKSMSGGLYPNAAIVYRDIELLTQYVDKNPDFHSSCGGGSDIGCYVSGQVIDFLVENNVAENARIQGDIIMQGLIQLANEHPNLIKEVRGVGMMLAIEYKYKFLGGVMAKTLADNGVFAAYSGNAPQVMRFMLAPTITRQEAEAFLIRVRIAVDELKFLSKFMIPFSRLPLIGRLLDNEAAMARIGSKLRRD
jgi:putrescine aminotransferase